MTTSKLENLLKRINFYDNPTRFYEDIGAIKTAELSKLKESMQLGVKSEKIPSEFLFRHDLVWQEHNDFDAQLTFLWEDVESLKKTPKGLETLTSLFEISICFDRSKRVLANIVKPIIDNYSKKMNLSPEEKGILFTSLTESFYVQYRRDVTEAGLDFVTEKYFRNNKNLANFMINQKRPQVVPELMSNLDWHQFHRRILLHQKTILAKKLGIEVFAIDQLLQRDHFQEYVYRKSLVGVGDYYLHLVASSLTKESIADFDKNLTSLEETNRKSKSFFEYNLPLFYQGNFRCAIASFLNGVTTLGGQMPTQEHENIFGDKILVLPGETTATLPNLLAQVAVEDFGLESTMLFENEYFLSNHKGAVRREYFEKYMSRFRDTLPNSINAGAKLEFGPISSENIRDKLIGGPIVIATWQEGITHYNLLYGYDDVQKKFLIFDPLTGKKPIRYENFSNYCNTPFGRWAITMNPKFELLKELSEKFKTREKRLREKIDYLPQKSFI